MRPDAPSLLWDAIAVFMDGLMLTIINLKRNERT